MVESCCIDNFIFVFGYRRRKKVIKMVLRFYVSILDREEVYGVVLCSFGCW